MIETLARQQGTDPVVAAIHRHADLVYATCRRILGDEADAADAAQETFFQFVQQAGRVRGSVAGWLHRVATRRCIDRIRQNVSRRRREEAYASEDRSTPDAWHEIEPLVDEALDALDPDARDLLVSHFLEGRSMAEIGAVRKLSQPTVSRRVAGALDALRAILREKGVMAATGSLGGWLMGTAEAAPAGLMQALGKMALVHTAAQGGAAAAGSALAAGKLAALAGTGAALLGMGWWLLQPQPVPVAPATNEPPGFVVTGFMTSVVWSVGPDGQRRVFTSGTDYTTTNPVPAGLGPEPRPR